MLHFELQRASDKLIREVFAVKKDEVVVITADTGSDMELVHAVASSVRRRGQGRRCRYPCGLPHRRIAPL